MSFLSAFTQTLAHEQYEDINVLHGRVNKVITFVDKKGNKYCVMLHTVTENSAVLAGMLYTPCGSTRCVDVTDADCVMGPAQTVLELNVDGTFGVLGEGADGEIGMSVRDYVASGLEVLSKK